MATNLQLGPLNICQAWECLSGTVAYKIFSPPNNKSLFYAVVIVDSGFQTFQTGSTIALVGGGVSYNSLSDCLAACTADLKTR